MNAEVVFTGDFRADLRAQTRRLIEDDRPDWAERLIEDVELVGRLLASSPLAGAMELERAGRSVRRLLLRRLPFVVWSHWAERSRKVAVLRLFRVRQSRPIPK